MFWTIVPQPKGETMTIVDDGVLRTAAMTNYLDTAGRRIVIGVRVALEALGIPVPEAAQRRSPGRATIKSILNEYHADHPAEGTLDRLRNLGR
jgi:hypothetical protein